MFFDEIKTKIALGKYLKEKKQIRAVDIPVELEKCYQALRLWCSRYATDKESGDKVMASAFSSLLEQ